MHPGMYLQSWHVSTTIFSVVYIKILFKYAMLKQIDLCPRRDFRPIKCLRTFLKIGHQILRGVCQILRGGHQLSSRIQHFER